MLDTARRSNAGGWLTPGVFNEPAGQVTVDQSSTMALLLCAAAQEARANKTMNVR